MTICCSIWGWQSGDGKLCDIKGPARTVNGARQAYEYDKKGQLLAVKDASGSKVEAYVYDAAGNILKKTVNGKTTRFEYDSANQLTKAYLPDGTVKDYAYDAAGRMVKDGNKTLAYGWLNKVMSITEGDKTVASYDYTVEGQVAKSNVNGKTETFVWDDLALIQRDSSELTNEPYMTGGNPILADGKVLFNDMLGSTMGVAADGSYSPINRTLFGEVDSKTNNDYNFFTGKPQVEGLGYAFLLRNYSANTGKWMSQDPFGYPDGWNNLAYGNNKVTNGIDFLGAQWKITVYDRDPLDPPADESTDSTPILGGGREVIKTTIVYHWKCVGFSVVENTSSVYSTIKTYVLESTTYTETTYYDRDGNQVGEPEYNTPTPQRTSQTYTQRYVQVWVE